ncbi:Rho GTPase-activating protein [Coemansia brasiliensis]|uniref:Rho GTPase-activating protein n=1 Tax=Coemansia brasiliensis TaxID=2650707 RepID=A0A9W8I3G6_9FUNG|nr:Rho GTPase-activating protein [Coemansia brasiliensis]
MYLRELPGGLIPTPQREQMLEYFSAGDSDELDDMQMAQRISGLADSLRNMPERTRSTIQCLFTHLDKVQAFQEYNMMNSENLSIVFGPTILPPANNNPANAAMDIRKSAKLVKFILDNRRSIFESL